MTFLVADLTNTSLINGNFGGGGSVADARLKDANVTGLNTTGTDLLCNDNSVCDQVLQIKSCQVYVIMYSKT